MIRFLLKNADSAFIGRRFVTGSNILVEDGQIKAIFENPSEQIDCKCFDLSGKILFPAFWDVHVHFFQTGIRLVEFDAGEYTCEEELFEAIKRWLASHGSVNGYGFSPSGDLSLPTKAQLDAISHSAPIFIRRIDGHSSCANSAALAQFGETLEGKIGFDYSRGYLSLEAQTAADRFMLAKLSSEQLTAAAIATSDEALRAGCANIGALVPNSLWMKHLIQLDMPIKLLPRLESLDPQEARELGLSRIGGCMPMVDGAFGSRTALLSKQYSDAPQCHGCAEITQNELDRWYRDSSGLSSAVHAIGDGAVDMVLRSVSTCKTERGMARIEHAELLRDEQIQMIADLGISLAVQPVFEAIWGGPRGMYSSRLGERWRSTNRFRDLLDAGVPIAGSSDSYITPIDPISGIRTAVNHPNPEQAISLEEAVGIFTGMAAQVEGEERGEISVGMPADFTIVEGDILSNDSKICATIIDGQIRYGALNG